MRIGLDVKVQTPAPLIVEGGTPCLRLTRQVGFWIGFRFQIGAGWNATPAPLMPIMMWRTDDVEDGRVSLASNGSMVVVENRFASGTRAAATRQFSPITRNAWQHIVIFMRRSATANGTMLAWHNGELIFNTTNAIVGLFNALVLEDPYLQLLVDGSVPFVAGQPAPVGVSPQAVEVFFDSVRVAQTELASGRALVEPDSSRQCPFGGNGCFCRDNPNSPCDGDSLLCAQLTLPGYCTRAAPGFTTCKYLGTLLCPCSAGMCAPGLVCRSIPANERALCHNVSSSSSPSPSSNSTVSMDGAW